MQHDRRTNKKEHVAVGVQAKDWERAIEASGSLLVKSGAVTSEYVKQMVDSVKENGPYIVIGPGMAMAHARPSEAVHTDAVSLAVLKEAVPFGNEENDPVDLVFSFSATGAESHLHLIERLSRLLLDEEKVGQLREAKSAEDVYQIIS